MNRQERNEYILEHGTSPLIHASRYTTCRHCELDIAGWWPFRRGEWRDQGNNTLCNDNIHYHAPYQPKK